VEAPPIDNTSMQANTAWRACALVGQERRSISSVFSEAKTLSATVRPPGSGTGGRTSPYRIRQLNEAQSPGRGWGGRRLLLVRSSQHPRLRPFRSAADANRRRGSPVEVDAPLGGGDAWGWLVLAAFAVTLLAGLAVMFGVHRFVTAYLLNGLGGGHRGDPGRQPQLPDRRAPAQLTSDAVFTAGKRCQAGAWSAFGTDGERTGRVC
jgi:hypothetical protein